MMTKRACSSNESDIIVETFIASAKINESFEVDVRLEAFSVVISLFVSVGSVHRLPYQTH